MRFAKILLVCFGLVIVFGMTCGLGYGPQNATIRADGGAPLPPPVLVADGGAPLPPPMLVADGGAPLPPPSLVADGGAPLPPPSTRSIRFQIAA
jgi:hypothetical protein